MGLQAAVSEKCLIGGEIDFGKMYLLYLCTSYIHAVQEGY